VAQAAVAVSGRRLHEWQLDRRGRPDRWISAGHDRPARSVIPRRLEAIRGSSSVQDPLGQLDSGHRNLRFTQTRRIGRPPMGRSTSSTRRRSFTWAITPQVGQPCGDRVSSTCTRSAAPDTSSTSRITTLGRPTSDTHRLQIVLGFTGALHSDGVRGCRGFPPSATDVSRGSAPWAICGENSRRPGHSCHRLPIGRRTVGAASSANFCDSLLDTFRLAGPRLSGSCDAVVGA
jgi:hypothetical protein